MFMRRSRNAEGGIASRRCPARDDLFSQRPERMEFSLRQFYQFREASQWFAKSWLRLLGWRVYIKPTGEVPLTRIDGQVSAKTLNWVIAFIEIGSRLV